MRVRPLSLAVVVGLSAAWGVMAPSLAFAQGLEYSINPASGPAGTVITYTGSGCPHDANSEFDGGFVFVTIPDGNFSGQEQSLFTSNPDGTFSGILAVPANQAAGTYATGISCFTNSEPAGWPEVPDYQPFEVTGAQEEPLCGPPGEEVPATIVGAGTIFGTRGDDVIVASPGNDIVFGGGGNDFICGEGGNDTLDGGKGNDVVIGDELDSVPFAPSNGANDDTLLGGPGDDTLAGLGGDDTLEGGPGDDQIIGFGGVDTIAGGPGNDTAFGGPLDDRMSGGPDDDTLWGNFGSDVISGGPGDDFIDGDNPFPMPPPFPPGGNNDTCSGGPGENIVQNCEAAA